MDAGFLLTVLGGVLTAAGAAVCLYWYVYWQGNYKGKLLTEGPYGVVRHPFYSGFIMLALGLVLAWQGYESRLLFVMTAAVMVVYVPKEEEALLKQYKKQYQEYMEKVRYKLIPGLY